MSTSTLPLPWQCEQCGARFFKENLLQMHRNIYHNAKNKPIDKMVQHIRKIVSDDQPNSDDTAEPLDRDNEECHSKNETADMVVKTEMVAEDEDQRSGGEEMSVVVVNKDGTMYMVQRVEGQTEEGEEMTALEVMPQENTEVMTAMEAVTDENGEVSTTMEITTDENEEISTSVEVTTEENGEEAVTDYNETLQSPSDTAPENDKEVENTEREQSLLKIMLNVNNFKQSNVLKYREVPSFPCKKCDQVFSTRHDRRLHLQTHARDLRFFCSVCGRGFYKMALLKLHSNVHIEGKQYQCSYCLKYYRSEVYLKKHVLIHTAHATRYECGICGQQYAVRDHLRTHMRAHETTTTTPPTTATLCSVCGLNYLVEGGRGGLRVRCLDCDSKFRRHTNSPRHMDAMTKMSSSSERPYTCASPGCLKSFRHPGHLRRHHATHMDDDCDM